MGHMETFLRSHGIQLHPRLVRHHNKTGIVGQKTEISKQFWTVFKKATQEAQMQR